MSRKQRKGYDHELGFVCAIPLQKTKNYNLFMFVWMNETTNKTSKTKKNIVQGLYYLFPRLGSSFKHVLHSLRIFDNYINFRIYVCIIDHHKYSMFYIVSR